MHASGRFILHSPSNDELMPLSSICISIACIFLTNALTCISICISFATFSRPYLWALGLATIMNSAFCASQMHPSLRSLSILSFTSFISLGSQALLYRTCLIGLILSCLNRDSMALWISMCLHHLGLVYCMQRPARCSTRDIAPTLTCMALVSDYQSVFISCRGALRVKARIPPSSAPTHPLLTTQSPLPDLHWHPNHNLRPCSPVNPDCLERILHGHSVTSWSVASRKASKYLMFRLTCLFHHIITNLRELRINFSGRIFLRNSRQGVWLVLIPPQVLHFSYLLRWG